jgi:RHS repeat-associated protein
VTETENDADTIPFRSWFAAPDGAGHGRFDPNVMYGQVAYAYGPGVDQPLSIVRSNYTDKDWNGNNPTRWPEFALIPHRPAHPGAISGTFGSGATAWCIASDHCVVLDWPTNRFPYKSVSDVYGQGFWHGSHLTDKRDMNGLYYRRNRYYDPSTGRFTQEDPIGLAGGLNVYGFAEGDPVSFSDPFGLRSCADIRQRIVELTKHFKRDWQKYQSFRQTGTENTGHEQELRNYRRGIENEEQAYRDQKCDDDDDPDHRNFAPTLEMVHDWLGRPIQPARNQSPPRGKRNRDAFVSALCNFVAACPQVVTMTRSLGRVLSAPDGQAAPPPPLPWFVPVLVF